MVNNGESIVLKSMEQYEKNNIGQHKKNNTSTTTTDEQEPVEQEQVNKKWMMRSVDERCG
jgi:hypothetical protein